MKRSTWKAPPPLPHQLSLPELRTPSRVHSGHIGVWDGEQRLARNALPSNAPRLVVTLHGLPATFARSFGFDLLVTT